MLHLKILFFQFAAIFLLPCVIGDSNEELKTENATVLNYIHQQLHELRNLGSNSLAVNVTDTYSNSSDSENTSELYKSQDYIHTEANGSSSQTSKQDDNTTVLNQFENETTTTTQNVPLLHSGENDTITEPETVPTPPALTEEEIKEKALGNLMQIFGISEVSSRNVTPGPAPEFMIELYNTITDTYGVTRAKNPYDAHVVRSFSEKDNSIDDFLFFNISGLEETETILEAELHIHRSQTPHEQLHPSLYLTPFYILSLYQVSDPTKLAIPDLHHLLGVHYVSALGSGWEVFNVKQSVLKWMSGQPNYGFLVVATSLGGDRVPVTLSRRRATLDNKQPILVLFTRDSAVKTLEIQPKPKVVQIVSGLSNNSSKEEEVAVVPNSSLEIDRFHHALLYKDSIRHPNSVNRFRSRRSKNQTQSSHDSSKNLTTCNRQDLLVSFEAIGWSSWIISPKKYNAFYCTGPCNFPLDYDVKPSNHAAVQSIVHELKLASGIGRPCCVPTTLLPISVLYYDYQDNIVLKQFPDMVVEQCGCS